MSVVAVKVFNRQSMEQTKLSLYIFLNFRQVDRTSNCEEIMVRLKIKCVQIKLKNNPNDVTYKYTENAEDIFNLLEVKLLLSGGFSSFIWRVLVLYTGSKREVTSTFKHRIFGGFEIKY